MKKLFNKLKFWPTLYVWLTAFLGAFTGVFLGFHLWVWTYKTQPVDAVNAVSVANTYIVYTTFIFTVASVILVVAGLWFSQHVAETNKEKETQLIKRLAEDLKNNEEGKAIVLIDKILENKDVIAHIEGRLADKMDAHRHLEADEPPSSAFADLSTALDLNGWEDDSE